MGKPSGYTIRRATGPLQMDGVLDEGDWLACQSVGPFQFPWHQEGEKEQTIAKLLWDDENLYASWHCHDRHISARETQKNGRVWEDDCVEVFISPNPEKPFNYYTFEINCVGTALNMCRCDWYPQEERFWEPEGVVIGHSIPGPTKGESPDDRAWAIEVAIPLYNFQRDAAHIPPRGGDGWRLNLNRCGGTTNAQLSLWSTVEQPPSNPWFHWPPNFGMVAFSREPVRQI